MKILNSSERKKILNKLNEQFGIKNLPYKILQFVKEKLRIYSGNINNNQLKILDKVLHIETIGLYFGKLDDSEIRLTIDGVKLLKNEISKNIVELDNSQFREWMGGLMISLFSEPGYKIIKFKEDFLGCGKSNGKMILNSIPKERRIR